MAAQASPHIVFDQALRRSGPGHVAVAGSAVYLGSDVGSVLEFHQGFARKAVNALPWYLALPVGVGGQLLDFRLTAGYLGVTKHAFPNRGNGSGGARIGGTVAIEAPQSERDMLLMGIGDRLAGWEGSCAYHQNAEKPDCAPQRLQVTQRLTPHEQELPRYRLVGLCLTV
jgi:hypothetical protein